MNLTQTAFIFAAVFGTMTALPLVSARADMTSNETVASQPSQQSSSGPYDGADYWAARNAYNN